LAVEPLAFVVLAVGPGVEAAARDFAGNVIAYVGVAVHELLKTYTVTLVIKPWAFIESAWGVGYDSFARSLRILIQHPHISRPFITFNFEICMSFQLFPIYYFWL
jgi:hypothetical protein